MIAHKNSRPPNKQEAARIDYIMTLPCLVCSLHGDFRQRERECHHIVRSSRRLGHWWTIELCAGHHRGVWTDQVVQVAISDGMKAFKAAHGYDDLELWQRQQVAICMDDSLPESRIFPRKTA